MNAIEFLAGTVAELPKNRSEPYPEFMNRLFEDYRKEITRISPTGSLEYAILRQLPKIEMLSHALMEIIELAVAGNRSQAYTRLEEAIDGIKYHLSMLMTKGDKSALINPMYRFRLGASNPITKGDLFHIPFQLRHIVKPMRYSVEGHPSLYLGGSTNVCWRELGKPNQESISVARFQAVQGTGLTILNFGFRPRTMAAFVQNDPELFKGCSDQAIMILGYIVCWPLIASCSVKVPDPKSTERPEYLVPQLLLEWVTKTHDYHGIRYFSTHYSEYPDDPKTYMNYVFPARKITESGYCTELCGFFELTEPVSWEVAKNTTSHEIVWPRYRTRGLIDPELEIEFGRVEDGLLGLQTGPLITK